MSREKKAEIIDRLQQMVSESSIGILTDYRGLSAQEMASLRRKLQTAGIDYWVIKNTLARFAAQRTGRDDLAGLFEGPVAIAFGYSSITQPAQVLTEYIRSTKSELAIKGGFLSDRLLTPEEVKEISTLPTKEVLLAKVLGGMQSPISALVSYLTAPLQGMAGLLQARIKQMEGE